MTLNKEYKGIDIVKFVCAILVIAIHTKPFSFNIWADRALGIITRLPVPYFFMVSGFFFDKKAKEGKALKYIKRLCILYLVNIVIYLPFEINELLFIIRTNLSVHTVLLWILRNLLLDGTAPHLWYLPASIFSLILFYSLNKKISKSKLVVISFILFSIGIINSTYSDLLNIINSNILFVIKDCISIIGTRNGLFYGFFFVCLGAYINEKQIKHNLVFYLVAFILSLGLLGFEALIATKYLRVDNTIMWFSQSIAGYYLFLLSSKIKVGISNEKSILLRNMSTTMYNFHYVFIYILNIFKMNAGFSVFGIVLIMTTLISIATLSLSKKYRIFKIY